MLWSRPIEIEAAESGIHAVRVENDVVSAVLFLLFSDFILMISPSRPSLAGEVDLARSRLASFP